MSKINDNPTSSKTPSLERIDGKYISKEISHVFNFQKGIFFTIKELVLRPGSTVKEFLLFDRNRVVKPIMFLLICSLIYTLFVQALHFEDGYIKVSQTGEDSTVTKIMTWIQSNYGYSNILMSIFISVWIKIFFRKNEYNFYEIMILLCFIMGIGMLLFSLFGVLESLTNLKTMQIGSILSLIYSSWSIGQFFEKTKITNYLKT